MNKETTGKPINGKLPTAHGRWEQREIWTTTALNDYLVLARKQVSILNPKNKWRFKIAKNFDVR